MWTLRHRSSKHRACPGSVGPLCAQDPFQLSVSMDYWVRAGGSRILMPAFGLFSFCWFALSNFSVMAFILLCFILLQISKIKIEKNTLSITHKDTSFSGWAMCFCFFKKKKISKWISSVYVISDETRTSWEPVFQGKGGKKFPEVELTAFRSASEVLPVKCSAL